jgi:hypothetical protein
MIARKEKDMEKREYNRFKTNGKLHIDFAIDNEVKIKNISIGGICLETTKNIKNNEIYSMRLAAGINEEILLTGVVVRTFLRRTIITNSNIFPVYEVALKFNELDNRDINSIERLISAFTL